MDRRSFLLSTVTVGSAAALAACTKQTAQPQTSGSAGATGSGLAVPPLNLDKCNNPEQQATGGTKPAAPGYSMPLAPAGTTIRVSTWDNYDTSRSYNKNLPVWQEIEKRTGVHVDWDVAEYTEWSTSMSTRLSANRDIPDFFAIPYPMDPVQLGLNGVIAPLNDLIDKYAPNIKANIFDPHPDIKKLLTAPDGNIYALTSLVYPGSYADPYGLIIRNDWLKKLGLREPGTLDDWYTVLKAFKTENPSGSGKKDEIPMIASNGQSSMFVYGNALGLHLTFGGNSITYPDAHGKLIYEQVDPRFRELLVWFNKLYREKLIDPQFYKSTATDQLQKVTNNRVGADQDFTNRCLQWDLAQAKAGNPEADWIMTAPPTSDINHSPYYELFGPTTGSWAISAHAKDPVTLIKWLDYIWASDEGNTLVTYGIEGKTYTVGANNRLKFTDWVAKNSEGLDPNTALRYYGAEPNLPWTRMADGPLSELDWDISRTNTKWYQNAKAVQCFQTRSFFLPLLGTPEESNEAAQITKDLFTYQFETVTKFILGQESLATGWDKYVRTMNGLGLPRYLAILQKQRDRYND
jgi:putative aldouronate transport system substrate-binding protein